MTNAPRPFEAPRTPLERDALAFRAELAREEARALRQMALAMRSLLDRLDDRLISVGNRVARQAAAGRVSPGAVVELGEFLALRQEAERLLTNYAHGVEEQTAALQRLRIEQALTHTRQLAETALPPGLTFERLARLGITWARIDPVALEYMVGRLRDGTSLRAYLEARVVNGTIQRVVDTLTTGIVDNPRITAAALRQNFAGGAAQAMRVARTETLRSYRDAARASYQRNPRVVKGYRRVASLDDRTCAACWILDGTLYVSSGDMDEHVQGRCFTVPETVTWRDLGLRGPEVERGPTGAERFRDLGPDRQRAIIGNKRQADAFLSGRIGLADLVQRHVNPMFGGQFVQASARASLAGEGLVRLPDPAVALQSGADLTR